MKGLHVIAFWLVVIGGLNWGLMALGAFMGNDLNAWNVVHMLLGSMMMVENIVYLLVGLSAIYLVMGHKKDCRVCNPSGM